MDFALARKNMIKSQLRTNHITDEAVIAAFEKIAREDFMPGAYRDCAYLDEDIPLKDGRVMLEPLLVAHILQSAQIKASDQVLVLGAGAGYEIALIAEFTQSIIAVESDLSLRKTMEQTLADHDKEYVAVIDGDYTQGYGDEAPFDVIIILGAIPEFPTNIAAQLRDEGRLIYIDRMEDSVGYLTKWTKSGKNFAEKSIRCAQVPILNGFKQEQGFKF